MRLWPHSRRRTRCAKNSKPTPPRWKAQRWRRSAGSGACRVRSYAASVIARALRHRRTYSSSRRALPRTPRCSLPVLSGVSKANEHSSRLLGRFTLAANCFDKPARFLPNSPNMKTPIPQVLIHHVMARVSQIYEARAKVSEILRRVTAAASVTTFFLASLTTFLVASCGPNSSQPTYDAAIQEGQTAAQELINQGASAVAIALVDDKRIIWSQGFGLADRVTGQMPTHSTMFGIGSVSKMFAAIAVMKLVGRV